MFHGGISREGDLLDLGVAMGFIKKSGSFFSFRDERIGQGRENAKEYLRQHPEVAQELERLIRENAARAKELLPGAADEALS
jgi:recombination protein RecA